MKKINRIISMILSMAIILMVMPLSHIYADGNMSMEADDNAVFVDEEKIYSNATIDDDFADDKVIVVMKHNISMEFKSYTVSDFAEINAEGINDLTYAVGLQVKAKTEKVNIVTNEGVIVNSDNNSNVDTYNQIITIELKEKGKQNVLNAIKTLEENDDIMYVGPDYIYRLASTEPPTEYPSEWLYGNTSHTQMDNLKAVYEKISLPQAWYIEYGSQNGCPIVGVIDSGIQASHPDLFPNVSQSLSKSFVSHTINDNPLVDSNGHGTHVASLIGATDGNDGIVGVCWRVKLVSLKVLEYIPEDAEYGAYNSNIISAINYAQQENIGILNFSLGSDGQDTPQERTAYLEAVQNYSGLLVCAAGNEYHNNDVYNHYPANFDLPNVITVGASDIYDDRADFSNYGINNVDLFAPGEDIYGCSNYNNGYDYEDGTSFAAPLVTGAAALVMCLNPNLTPSEVRDVIMNSVDQTDSLYSSCVTGGRLNVFKALLMACYGGGELYNPASVHVCSIIHTYIDSTKHSVSCSSCDFEYVEKHTLDSTGSCDKCSEPPHSCRYTYTSINRTTHRATCVGCEASHTENHTMQQSGSNLCCTKCGYNFGAIMKHEEDNEYA